MDRWKVPNLINIIYPHQKLTLRSYVVPIDALDKTSAVQTIDESEVLWDNFSRYYAENERTIRRASQLDIVKGARNPKELKREMEAATFLENSKTILQGLQFLSGLHPTLGRAPIPWLLLASVVEH